MSTITDEATKVLSSLHAPTAGHDDREFLSDLHSYPAPDLRGANSRRSLTQSEFNAVSLL